jgi:hypothetical protein
MVTEFRSPVCAFQSRELDTKCLSDIDVATWTPTNEIAARLASIARNDRGVAAV